MSGQYGHGQYGAGQYGPGQYGEGQPPAGPPPGPPPGPPSGPPPPRRNGALVIAAVVAAVLVLAVIAGVLIWVLVQRGSDAAPPTSDTAPPTSRPPDPERPSEPPVDDPEGDEILPEEIGDYQNRGGSEEGPVIGALYVNSDGAAFTFQAMAGEDRDTLLSIHDLTDEEEVGDATCGLRDEDSPVCGTETAEYGVMAVALRGSPTVEDAADFVQEGAALMP